MFSRMPDVAAVRDRLRELNSLADRIPVEALTHFAFALPDDLDRVPYLDMTIEQSQAFEVPIYYGSLVALTDAGLMVEVSYDNEVVWPLDMQPLRGRVSKIALAYDPNGRIPSGALTVTLTGPESTLTLPISLRRNAPDFVRRVIVALIGS
jgi:hypothetical protein